MSDTRLPSWAAIARRLFRALLFVYGLMWLIRLSLGLSNLVFDTHFLHGDEPAWLEATGIGLFAFGVFCGLLWLAGEAVAGYGEPESE